MAADRRMASTSWIVSICTVSNSRSYQRKRAYSTTMSAGSRLERQCLVCGKTFTYTPAPSASKPREICSLECKKERRRQRDRAYYIRGLEGQGKQRTRGSIQFGRLRCSITGCDGKYYAKGMCNKHYARVWRSANPEASSNASRRYRSRAKAPPTIGR